MEQQLEIGSPILNGCAKKRAHLSISHRQMLPGKQVFDRSNELSPEWSR